MGLLKYLKVWVSKTRLTLDLYKSVHRVVLSPFIEVFDRVIVSPLIHVVHIAVHRVFLTWFALRHAHYAWKLAPDSHMLSWSFLRLLDFLGILFLFKVFKHAINSKILLTLWSLSLGRLFRRFNLFLFFQNYWLVVIYNINQRQDNLLVCIGPSMVYNWNRSISNRLQHHLIVVTLACTDSQKWLYISSFIWPIVTSWTIVAERSSSEIVRVFRLSTLTFVSSHASREL